MNKTTIIRLAFVAALGLSTSACSVHSSTHSQETRYGGEAYSEHTASSYQYSSSRYGGNTSACGVYVQPCGYVVQQMPVQQLYLRPQMQWSQPPHLPEPVPPVTVYEPEPTPEPPIYVPPTPEPPVYSPPMPEPPTYYPPIDAPEPPTWLPPKK